MNRAPSLVLLLSCLSLLFGCTEDLSSPGEVKNLRILAIRANSPMLAVGQRTELDALVVANGTTPIAHCQHIAITQPREQAAAQMVHREP